MLSNHRQNLNLNFDADTVDTEIKAPKQKPMESEELPPQLMLEKSDISSQFSFHLNFCDKSTDMIHRKGSLDTHFTILGFLNKNIREKSRQRIMSEELSHLRL